MKQNYSLKDYLLFKARVVYCYIETLIYLCPRRRCVHEARVGAAAHSPRSRGTVSLVSLKPLGSLGANWLRLENLTSVV